MSARLKLKGKIFGRLEVLNFSHVSKRHSHWKCKCSCGKIKIFYATNLVRGKTKSCGCLNRDLLKISKKKHGDSFERLYRIYAGIKSRCFNKKNEFAYKHYGGRGIKICDEWNNSYESFKKWALKNGYSKNLTINRIDNNGNYCPENCNWATTGEQSLNRRTSFMITFNGKTQALKAWANELNLKYPTLWHKIRVGKMSFENAVKHKKGERYEHKIQN